MIDFCPYCSSPNFVRNGHDKKGVQRCKCCDCKKRFCEKGIFARMRTPKEIIMNALYLRSYTLSLRNVKRVIKKLKFYKTTHVSIYNWIMKFYPRLSEIEKKKPINFTNIWHVDEKFIRVRKSKDPFAYLWVVSDSNSNIIAVHVSNGRNVESAKIVLRKAKERTGFDPRVIVTDGLQGSKSATKIFGRKVKHVVAHFEKKGIVIDKRILLLSNNKIERINGFFALWLHVCRGLKSFKTANIWIDFFAMHYNYLMPHGEKEEVRVEWEEIPLIIQSR